MEKSGAVPVRATIRGLPVPLSLMERDALRVPMPAGENVTLIVQPVPAATVEPQALLLMAKSPGLCPVRETFEIASWALPVFVSSTVCGALVVPIPWSPNANTFGATPTVVTPADVATVNVNVTLWVSAVLVPKISTG
jgi:hypothetical protein